MGGGGSKSKPVTIGAPQTGPNQWENQLGMMSQELWNQTGPVRGYIAKDWENLFNPAQGRQYDPTQLPAFNPLYNMARTGLEDQYGVAKENILSNMPRGGGMQRAMGQLEMGRAKDVGSLTSQLSAPIISDLYNKAYNSGYVTGPTEAFGGMGAAGQLNNVRSLGQAGLDMRATEAALAMTAQEEAANAKASAGKGAGVGSMMGKGLGSFGSSIGSTMGNAVGGLFGGSGGKGGGNTSYLSGMAANLPKVLGY